jgi:protochlorophyllide reductase
MKTWTIRDMPTLQGHIAIVTGGSRGLGLETSRALAAKGAHVIIASRSLEAAHQAQAAIRASVPQASLDLVQLDLASLASVRAFADRILNTYDRLDLLMNNGGAMGLSQRETTQEGFERQLGTNHLGHFALSGLLLPLLLATAHSRVVTTTSVARARGKIDFNDLNRSSGYVSWEAYGQSKRANLLFAFEFQRRLEEAHADTISVAAHPGIANTTGANQMTATRPLANRVLFTMLSHLVGQTPSMVALPQLYAATAPNICGGELIGPAHLARGYPKIESRARHEYDYPTAERLWEVSVELTGVDFAELRTA